MVSGSTVIIRVSSQSWWWFSSARVRCCIPPCGVRGISRIAHSAQESSQGRKVQSRSFSYRLARVRNGAIVLTFLVVPSANRAANHSSTMSRIRRSAVWS